MRHDTTVLRHYTAAIPFTCWRCVLMTAVVAVVFAIAVAIRERRRWRRHHASGMAYLELQSVQNDGVSNSDIVVAFDPRLKARRDQELDEHRKREDP